MKQFKKGSILSCLLVFSLLVMPVMVTGQANGSKAAKTEVAGKLININTASAQELVVLPRIGEKIAERIVAYRKENGLFKRKQDIMKVKGIGEKLFTQIENRITI